MARPIRVRHVSRPEHFERPEQGRRGFAAADGDADGFEHLAGFDSEAFGRAAQGGFEAIVRELGLREDVRGLFEYVQGQGGVALFRDQFGCGIGREFVGEEEVGGGEHVVEKADALADERRDFRHFLRLDGIAGGEDDREQPCCQNFDRQGADVFGVQPDGFGIEGVGFGEVHERVAAVHAFEGKSLDEFVESHLLAVVAGRPAEQAEEIDEAFGQEARVAVGDDGDDRAVFAFRELAAIGRDEKREMRELRGGGIRRLRRSGRA